MLNSNNINFMFNGRQWKARAIFDNITFTENQIVKFSISGDQDSSKIIGATQGRELELTLMDIDKNDLNGIFRLEVGLYYYDESIGNYVTQYVSMGSQWKVESVEQKNSQNVIVTAIDPMVYLFENKIYEEGGASEEITTTELVAHIEDKFGIKFDANIPELKIINPYKETYRNCISYLAMICSSNAFFKYDEMTIKFVPLIPKTTPDLSIDGNFYFEITYDRSEFQVKQIQIDLGDNFGYTRGEGLEEDEKITLKIPFGTQEICDLIYSNLNGYTQEGINAKFLAHPCLEPFDTLEIEDIYGVKHLTLINGYSIDFDGGFTMSLSTEIMKASNTTTNYVENSLRTKIKVEADKILSIVESEYQKKKVELQAKCNMEQLLITLDEDMTPSKDTFYELEFTVIKNNTTEEIPCVIKSLNSSDNNLSFEYDNTSNIVKVIANTNTIFNNENGYFEVVIETTEGDVRKTIFYNTVINDVVAPLLILSSTTDRFTRENQLVDFKPSSITLTPNLINCEFIGYNYSIDEGETFLDVLSGSNGLTISGNSLIISKDSDLFNNTSHVIFKCSGTSNVSDTITINRIEDSDMIYVMLSNENHSFIKDKAESLNVEVIAYKGTDIVECTIGTITVPEGMTATVNGQIITLDVDETFEEKSGTINIPITCQGVNFNKEFSYVLLNDISTVNINPSSLVFKRDNTNSDYLPETIKLEVEFLNCDYSKWQYYDGIEWIDIDNTIEGLTIDENFTLNISNTLSIFTDGSLSFKAISDKDAYDICTIIKIKDGQDSFNILLDNENHTFLGNYEGYAIDGQSVDISLVGFLGKLKVPLTIGTINQVPNGMRYEIIDNDTIAPILRIKIDSTFTTKSGTLIIPVTSIYGVTDNETITAISESVIGEAVIGEAVIGRENKQPISYLEKVFSYSLSLDGTPASNVKIVGSSNTFISGDGGTTYTPSILTFEGVFTECNFSKWQYYDSVRNEYLLITSGSNGFTLKDDKLIVAVTSPLFNEKGGSITVKLLTDKNGVCDIITINKLTQIDDLDIELENIRSEIKQTNYDWKASFTTANSSNLLFDGDFDTLISKWNWAVLNDKSTMYSATVNAYPFYENHVSMNTTFIYDTECGVQYSLDLELKPDTDYVYQAYIYVEDDSLITTSEELPLSFWTWTSDSPTSTETNITSEIIDYSQILYSRRYNLVYVHFKTKDLESNIKCRLFIKGKTNTSGNVSTLSIRQVCFRERNTVGKYEGNKNEIIAGVTTIDMNGITVEHTLIGTKTEMSADGFRIMDTENEDNVISEWSSKKFWTEFKADKIFAKNIENVYEGEANLYVDHSATVAGDGTSSKPFNSFAQLSNHLMENPVINKDIYIVVRDPGFVINEQLRLDRLKGTGFIKITLEDTLVIANPGNGQFCIRLHQIPKWVWITSGREFGSSTTGAVLQDGGDGNGHGIYATDVDRLEIDSLTIACKNWGIHTERTHLYTWHVDFGKCYCAVELEYQSIYYSSDDVGSCVDFCRIKSGSFAYWGYDGGTPHRPKGDVRRINGMHYDGGISLIPTDSPRFPSSNPTPPPTSGQIFTYTYDWTSHKTYQYQWSNWGDSDCKQGAWGYGLRGGHMFFDISTLRSQMSGTVQDGNTITLTRASSGGISGGANVYINGSTCSSASGTPSYSNQTFLGTLAWGETKTFTLPKEIVQNLINGTCNSLAVYVNSTASNCYLNIVNASITLKTKK